MMERMSSRSSSRQRRMVIASPHSHVFVGCTEGAVAATQIFDSSLPGLTRQSMQRIGSLEFAKAFCQLSLSMDHRIKSGGDEGKQRRVVPRGGIEPPTPAFSVQCSTD